MLVARPGGVAVLCDADPDWEQFRAAVIAQMDKPGSCRVGVGAPCIGAPEFPRSLGQALLAVKMQIATGCPEQVTVFDDLGVCQLLSENANIGAVEAFIHRWLGTLLDYDTTKGAPLVETLSGYLWNAVATTTPPPKCCHCIAAPCATGCNGSAMCPVTTSTTPTPSSTCSSPPGPG